MVYNGGMDTKHTCNTDRPGQALPFGRKAPEGECARCDELRSGAAPRSGWQKEYFGRKARLEAADLDFPPGVDFDDVAP